MPSMNALSLNHIYQQLTADFNQFKIFCIVLVLLGTFIILRVGNAALTRLFERAANSNIGDAQKVRTIAALVSSVLRYCVYFVAIVIILGLLGVQTGALLAGAGVVGLAIGFGAKSLVEDVLAGLFILFEDQFAVGDYVTAMNVSGVVEAVGMRVTRLRDLSGMIHYLPNGKILLVTNHSRGSIEVSVDVQAAYSADHNQVFSVLEQACRKLQQEQEGLLDNNLEVLGLVAVNASYVHIRISGTVSRLKKAKTERLILKYAKEAMNEAGIKATDGD